MKIFITYTILLFIASGQGAYANREPARSFFMSLIVVFRNRQRMRGNLAAFVGILPGIVIAELGWLRIIWIIRVEHGSSPFTASRLRQIMRAMQRQRAQS